MKSKKIGIYLSICLSIILFLPSVPVLADDIVVPGYYTQESLNNYFSGSFNGNVDINTEAKRIYEALNNGISMEDLLNVNNIDFSSYSNGYSLIVTAYQDYVYFDILIHLPNYQYLPCILKAYDSSSVNVNWNYIDYPITNYNTMVYIDHYESRNGDLSSRTRYDMTRDWGSATYGYYEYRMAATLLYCTNIMGVFSGREAYSVQPYGNTFLGRTILDHVYHGVNNYEFTNYWSDSLPYFDGNNIIDPDNPVLNDESNLNHLYLTNFDIGFCKPYHNEDLYRAGGGYVYLKYNFDSWVNSHISDYNLQIITELNVNGNTTSYPTVRNLDAQGISVFSFKEMASSFNWDNQNMLFLEYPDSLFGNYNIGYVYSLSANQYINSNFGARSLGDGARSRRLFYSGHGSTVRLTGGESDSTIQDYFTGSSNTQFKISFIVRLVDVQSNEVSGSYVEQFDLITGVSTVSNDQIRDNTNPYISDTDIYVPVEGSDGGFEVVTGSDIVNVYNMTPSQIKLTIDNGLSEFVDWYNNAGDGEVATNYFWGTLVGTFKNNPATELYREYFGFLPDSFKNLILACCGIGVVGGVFSILRHKL